MIGLLLFLVLYVPVVFLMVLFVKLNRGTPLAELLRDLQEGRMYLYIPDKERSYLEIFLCFLPSLIPQRRGVLAHPSGCPGCFGEEVPPIGYSRS